jgi:transcriptional regulator with XRE-family HTH domain
MGLPEVIQGHRGRLRLSQAELAQRVGVRQATISEWESGKSAPTAANLHAMAIAFGITVRDLHVSLSEPSLYPRSVGESGAVFSVVPDWVDRRIVDFDREMARTGVPNTELNFVAAILRSPATMEHVLQRADGGPRTRVERERQLEILIEAMRFWMERSLAEDQVVVGAIQPTTPGGVPVARITPAPRLNVAEDPSTYEAADTGKGKGKKK